MTNERQRSISEMLWRRYANVIRDAMKKHLNQLFKEYEFLDRSESHVFGQSYWSEANAHAYDETHKLEEVLTRLDAPDRLVLWLHRHSNDAGVLKVRLGSLLESSPALRSKYGPDFLFAGEDLSFGVCFEVSEAGTCLRWWHRE